MPTQVPAPGGERRDETLVLFTPFPPAQRLFFTLFFLAMIVGFTFLAGLATRDVTLDASHGTGQLVITRTYPLLGPRRDFLSLASVLGTGLRSRVAKGGGLTYALTLRTAEGEDTFSSTYARDGRQARKRDLDAFLADPEAPPLHLLYDQGSPWGFLVLIAPAAWLWVLWTLWQEATVRFEWWRGALVLERRRWPLRLWTRAFRLGEVAGAEVVEKQARRRPTYRVVLTLATGEEVPLLDVSGAGRARHEETAAVLQGVLRAGDKGVHRRSRAASATA